MTRKERKDLYARWDKVTIDDLVAMSDEEYDRYRIYVAKKRKKSKETKK